MKDEYKRGLISVCIFVLVSAASVIYEIDNLTLTQQSKRKEIING